MKPDFNFRFLINIGNQLKVIYLKDITHFKSEQHVNYAYLPNGSRYILHPNYDLFMLSLLDNYNFFHIRRGVIVNIYYIKEMLNYSKSTVKVTMSNNDVFITPREKATEFKKWLTR